MIRKSLLLGLGGAIVVLAQPQAAGAQTRADLIPLGQSAASGAVCQAVRDYDDPVVQAAGRRSWSIRCRGWEGSLGRLYALPKTADAGVWETALATRADCADAKSEILAGLGAVNRRACRSAAGKAPYLAYASNKGGQLYAAEGAAQIADVLEAGLKVVSGAAKAPAMSEVQTSAASAEIAADFGGATGGLARSQAAAATDPNRLRARAYVQNNEWRFDQAETDFQALVADAEARRAPAAEMGDALLNLALNVSNNGRFAEADRLFADAEVQVKASGDPLLAARARTYRALHLRNAGRFADAVTASQAALRASEEVRTARGLTTTGPTVTKAGDDLAIGGDLSSALNNRPGGRDVMGGSRVSTSDRLAVQDAQALEVMGSSLAAQGDAAGGREALARADRMLTAAEANGALNVWLRARIEADLAEIDMDAGQPAQAIGKYNNAIRVIRLRHAGTAAEGGLLLDLGRAQIGAGQEDAALVTYARAFELFQAQRGALGASADDAAPYFDLLIKRIASDPAKADDYKARFFNAASSVVSNATAQTVSKLAARVASGDSAVTGLVRALEDTRRELRATEAQSANLQAANTYEGQARTDLEARLKTLQEQSDALENQLLAANPRYAQLVSSQATLGDLQKALGKDEVYVKILLLDSRGYGLLVSPTTAKPYTIELNRGTAGVAVRRLRASFEAEDTLPAFDVAGAYKLFQQLLGPVADEVMAAKHLVYEPDGGLISLPVAALVTADPAAVLAGVADDKDPDYRKVAWLGAKVDSALVLSAASFMQSRAFAPSKARQSFLGFADPATPRRSDARAYSSVVRRSVSLRTERDISNICESTRLALLQMPALPDTADEVRQVGASIAGARGEQIVVGAAFTDASVKARTDLSDYKVLYFATHGLLPQPSACLPEPALMTSVGVGDSDGLLDASEILDLKLDADLVVLSACDTGGAGGEASTSGLQGGGEALGGLTRAVIYAGGRSLIVSHWSVDSVATVRLMTGMFSATATSQAGALTKAQVALQQSQQWSHPYFWAPFTIVGDGSRPMPGAGVQTAGR
ncbi:MAG: CHAT domain-containing protein [Alphaproteobacteria bacterium]|nr:CHAT domain-containing protein [Alphaproteobacteria bacterium]MBU1516455.1 CHAT domain-containing protein [Alphaproteobacteria bacterium]MBU2094212.1 CHAT domain-containing protein [Alphaproteobacteria bacterium]MBU2154211.1 CHAT domain-containing protein [Alphaproteobacteria bacterium]MBU2307382.1 CHAT domain-containing protein [Alphaproteobacteria bacterium]